MNKIKHYTILVLSVFIVGMSFGFLAKAREHKIEIKQNNIIFDAYIKNIEYGYDFGGAIITIDGQDRLYTWGNNTSGQLGKGDNVDYTVEPELVYTASAGSTIKEISLGKSHAGMVVNDGSKDNLYVWGSNSNGELGLGNTTDTYYQPTLQGSYDEEILNISFGKNFSYMLTEDTTDEKDNLYTWGNNEYGQLGTGNTNDASTPQSVVFLNNNNFEIKNIVAGDDTGYYVQNDGSSNTDKLYSAGRNDQGQMAVDPSTLSSSSSFILGNNSLNAPTGSSIIAITANDDSFYEIIHNPSSSSYTLKSVGNNQYGQLGDGTTTSTYTPKVIINGSDQLTNLSSGGYNAGVIKKSSTQYTYLAWGRNNHGQVGVEGSYSTDIYNVPTPIKTENLSENQIVDLTFSYTSAMFLLDNAETNPDYATQDVYAVGDNRRGQLGDSGATSSFNNVPEIVVSTRATDHPEIINSQMIIDENSITSSSFEFSLQISDPADVFDPDNMVLYSNGNQLNINYLEEVSQGVYKFQVIDLTPSTTYTDFEIQPDKDKTFKTEVEASATTLAPQEINLNSVAVDEQLTTGTTATFVIDAALNDYQVEDISSIDYQLENITNNPGNNVEGTSGVSLNSDGNLIFTIEGLNPNSEYGLSNIKIIYTDEDDSETSSNTINTNESVEFNTTSSNDPILNEISLSEDDTYANSARFILDLDFNDYSMDDITSVNYTLNDQISGTNDDQTTDLLYDPSNGEYYFIVDSLLPGTYYNLLDVYLTFDDYNGTSGTTNSLSHQGDNEISFNTSVERGKVESAEILEEKITDNSINIEIDFGSMGTFDPDDVTISYNVNGNKIDKAIDLELIEQTGENSYEYKIPDLEPGTIYSNFEIFLPSEVDNQGQLIYNYQKPDYIIDKSVNTTQQITTIDSEYGLVVDKRGSNSIIVSVDFNNLGVSPEFIQIGYKYEDKTINPSTYNPTLEFIKQNKNGSYQFEIINLKPGTKYSDLIFYAPTKFIKDSNQNVTPLYNSASPTVYGYYGTIKTKSVTFLDIFMIFILLLIYISLVAIISYHIGKNEEEKRKKKELK